MEDYLKGREMRTVIKEEKSEWREVKSGVPQGSVLAPIMFLAYVNDMTEGVSSYISLFADDAKEKKDLGVLIPEKNIDIIFGNTFRMLRNIGTVFHILDKDMMRKIVTSIITKTGSLLMVGLCPSCPVF